MQMNRYKYLDIARGIGLMLVIISHSCGLSRYLINFYIPLFFVVSGYIYKEGRSYKENIFRKAKRLLVPYFGYSALLFVFYAVIRRKPAEILESGVGILYSRYCLYDTTQVTDNRYLFTVANGAMWYLTAFFVTGLVYHLVIDRCLASRKFLAGCMTVLLAVTMVLAELPILLPWSLDLACVGTMFMIVGTLLGRTDFFERDWNVPLIFLIFAVYMGLSYINPGINMSVREYGAYGALSVPVFFVIGVTGSLLCIWLGKLVQDLLIGNVLCYIGQNTIVLLALHILGLEFIGIAVGKFVDVKSLPMAGYVFYHMVRISLTVAGCLLFGKLVEGMKHAYERRKNV